MDVVLFFDLLDESNLERRGRAEYKEYGKEEDDEHQNIMQR